MRTILLLLASNLFMTVAWYGHLKFREVALWKVIAVSWLIALPEYILQVPANRIGSHTFSPFQLKMIQEIITLVVFMGFAVAYLGQSLRWNQLVACLFILAAVYFAWLPGAREPKPAAAAVEKAPS